MNQRILEQFLALADSLHFGHASQSVNVSLSTLSRNIRQLEEELGVALFQRDNRSVQINAHGRIVELYARDALVRLSSLKQQLAQTTGPLRGELSLYCSVTASHSILFNLLERFRPAYPGVEIKLQTGDPEEAIPRVVADRNDISIAAYPSSLPVGVIYSPVATSPLLFIAPLQKLDATIYSRDNDAREEKGLEDHAQDHDVHRDPAPGREMREDAMPINWQQVPMIIPASGLARKRLDAWFKTQKVSPNIYAQVAGNEAIVSMVSLGMGIGVVPKIVLDNSPVAERVRILDVTPELEPFKLGLVTLKRNLNNPLVQAFWEVGAQVAS